MTDIENEYAVAANIMERFIDRCQYPGDASSLVAAIYDILEGSDKLRRQFIPPLSIANLDNLEDALGAVIDLSSELDHLLSHLRDAHGALSMIQQYLEQIERDRCMRGDSPLPRG